MFYKVLHEISFWSQVIMYLLLPFYMMIFFHSRKTRRTVNKFHMMVLVNHEKSMALWKQVILPPKVYLVFTVEGNNEVCWDNINQIRIFRSMEAASEFAKLQTSGHVTIQELEVN